MKVFLNRSTKIMLALATVLIGGYAIGLIAVKSGIGFPHPLYFFIILPISFVWGVFVAKITFKF